MAAAQFTEIFLANLPSANETTLPEFYHKLLVQTPAVYRMDFLLECLERQAHVLPQLVWRYSKDDATSQRFREMGNECFVRLEFVEALVSDYTVDRFDESRI